MDRQSQDNGLRLPEGLSRGGCFHGLQHDIPLPELVRTYHVRLA